MSLQAEPSLPALVLFSHGSLLCGSGITINAHADRLRASGRYLTVEPGYLNYSKPAIEEAIARCAAAGADHIIIVPYFLVAGKFVVEDLPDRLRRATADYSQIRFTLARALEDAAPLADAIEDLVQTAVPPANWQTRAIRRAHELCELRVDCPLYGSPLCRKGSTDAR